MFNWLQPVIDGARCLDLFAGTGALGIEALSRGASRAVFVERNAEAVARLRTLLSAIDAGDAEVVHADATAFLGGRPQVFDIVLLDPPFTEAFPGRLCTLLEAGGWLASRAWIVLEHARRSSLPPLPASWTLHRSRHAGQVAFHLALRSAPAEPDTI